jgi:DNA-binding MarR family transcriptional regulator
MKDVTGNGAFQCIAEIDRIIHEPARLMIVAYLYVIESADFLFLMRQTGLTFGNLSSHISRLESAGYVSIEKGYVEKKPRTKLRLSKEGRAAFSDYLAAMRKMMDSLHGETRIEEVPP